MEPVSISKRILLGAMFVMSLAWIFLIGLIPLDSDKEVRAPFLAKIDQERALLFFGPIYCGSECPMVLSELALLFETHEERLQGMRVIFVNLEEDEDPGPVEVFAKSFHPDFLGLQIPPGGSAEVFREFGVTYQPRQREGGGFVHSEYLYLLERKEGRWSQRYLQKGIEPKERLLDRMFALQRGEL